MKKFLLSIAAMACAASMSATTYTVFDIAHAGLWEGDANGWGQIVSFGDKQLKVYSDKAESTSDLKAPNENSYSWRVYKKSKIHVEATGINMKKMVITYDAGKEGDDFTYCKELTLGAGWTGSLSANVFTATAATATTTFEGAANEAQVRITSIVVSDTDEIGEAEIPTSRTGFYPFGEPELPEGVLYQNPFNANLDGWDKINDASLSDFNGWKINSGSGPKCAICNAYYGGSNHPANAKMQRTFDLTNATDVKVSFGQAYGWDFPTSQVENYRVYVISGGTTQYLTLANFPPLPESGKNWSASFATNEFDLSEYDGTVITIGFEYATDGSKSRAWEIKDFVLSGNGSLGSVAGIEIDENVAPVYYNMQGVRVDNPENGLFIEVRGNKSAKVIF